MVRDMIETELFKNAVRNLRQQGLRSYLTLLGIVIGIAAVISLISIGQGLSMAVEQEFESLGSTTIIILPGGSMTESLLAELGENDADLISKIRGVESATAMYMITDAIEVGDESKTIVIIGIDPDQQEALESINMLAIGEGRALGPSEKYGILIGNKISEGYFEEDIQLRQRLNIEDIGFRVVGIIESQSRSFGTFFNIAIIMNSDTLKEISEEEITPFRIIAKAINKESVPEVRERIIYELEKDHGQKDFMLMGQQQIEESATAIIGIIQAVLIGLAAISLLVGGLGIMNTMFMSITERTKEIGIMKAVGATNTTILSIFLVESSLIGLIGGIIGIILGFTLSMIISAVATYAGMGLESYMGIELIIGAMLFSMSIGVISGLLPSMRAAKMQPVDALRVGD